MVHTDTQTDKHPVTLGYPVYSVEHNKVSFGTLCSRYSLHHRKVLFGPPCITVYSTTRYYLVHLYNRILFGSPCITMYTTSRFYLVHLVLQCTTRQGFI